MKWVFDALKILANNPTVPGVVLRDAINEIEQLQVIITKKDFEISCKAKEITRLVIKSDSLGDECAELAKNLREAREAIKQLASDK